MHNITHPKTQCRCSSLKSAWVIHEDLLTNFRACAKGQGSVKTYSGNGSRCHFACVPLA